MSGTIISGDRRASIEATQHRAARAASGLEALGIGPADTVALFLRNDIAALEAAGAAGLLGAYAVPINWHLAAEEAAYILRDCQARVLIIHADLLPRIEDAIPPGVTTLVVETPPELAAAYGVPEEACSVPSGFVDWSRWMLNFPPWPPRRCPRQVQ